MAMAHAGGRPPQFKAEPSPKVQYQWSGYPKEINMAGWFESRQTDLTESTRLEWVNSIRLSLKKACRNGSRTTEGSFPGQRSPWQRHVLPVGSILKLGSSGANVRRVADLHPDTQLEVFDDYTDILWGPTQTWLESRVRLGAYRFQLDELDIKTRECCGIVCYIWTAKLRVYDPPGVQSTHDGPGGRLATALGAVTDAPDSIIAEWSLGGEECCSQ
jgi:hypothetical protein